MSRNDFDYRSEEEYPRKPLRPSRDDYDDDFADDFEYRRSRRRREHPHTGWGITSTCLGIAAGVVAFLDFTIAGILANQQGGELNENASEAMAIDCVIFLSLGLAFVGGLAGLAGVVLPDRNKLFGILGLIINVLVFFGICGLVCLGVAMG